MNGGGNHRMAKEQQEGEPRTKITAPIIARFNGLTVYGKLRKAKREGKNHISIHIRQADPKRFRVCRSLAYARAVDLQFEEG
jgi:hypothetical protein